jgi:hypothetical protein
MFCSQCKSLTGAIGFQCHYDAAAGMEYSGLIIKQMIELG